MKEDDIRRVLNWQADENEAAEDEEVPAMPRAQR